MGVRACTCSGVYNAAEPALDQRGFEVRRDPPPPLEDEEPYAVDDDGVEDAYDP